MLITFIALSLFTGSVTCKASPLTQEDSVTFTTRQMMMEQVFDLITQQLKYDIFYSENELDIGKIVQMPRLKMKLTDVLDHVLQKEFTYRFDNNNTIIIRPAKPIETPKTIQIRGSVMDKKKIPLPGVTVMIKGTTIGVATDKEGHFTITPPQDANIELIFSFVGMKPKTITYKGEKDLTVIMEEDFQEMEEVVITGYQVLNKKKSTSAISSMKMDDIMIPSASSIDQMLEGRVTDMILMTNSGEVGVAPKIRIRGTSTLVGNREPLWVVDGIIVQDPVPISAEELNDPDYINRIGNAIAGINPQDIERLDILKDAAATALYGTKAANGVIVITTKKGHIGAPIINYNMTTTLRQRPRYSDRKIDLMNSKERIQFSKELFAQRYVYDYYANYSVGYEGLLNQLYNKEITDSDFDKKVAQLETMNTDWFKLLTEDSFSHQHTVSISGGSEKTRYYASLGYTRENDVIKGNYNQRYTAALNLETTFSKWVTAFFQLQGNESKRKYNQSDVAPIDYAYKTSRAIPAYDESREYHYYQKRTGFSTYRFNYNILNELENSYNKQHIMGLTVNANLRFNFTEWLNANAIISYTTQNTEIEGYWGEKTFYAAKLRDTEYGTLPATGSSSVLPFGGELTRDETNNNSITVRIQVNINKYFGAEEKHNINASAGWELSSSHYDGFKSVTRGYYPDRGKIFVDNISITDYPTYGNWLASNVPTIMDNKTNMLSGFISVLYSYKNYFTFNVNGRIDGSNNFGDKSNDKLLPIWSISGAYNFSEHEALKAKWIDYMTLKVSFGYQGNMLSDQSPALVIKKLPLDNYYNKYKSEIARYPNPNLKWEKTSSLNTGFMFSILQRRIQFEGQYYYKRTNDAFMTKKIASMNGINSYIINGGDIENSGYSIDITISPIMNQDFRWTLSTSFSKNFNKVKSDPDSQTYELTDFLNGTAVIKGKAINTFYSYKFIGLSSIDGGPLFDDMEARQQELDGLSKYETYTKVLKASGRREPYMSGGLNTTLRYKNLRMSGAFAYSLGSKVRLFRLFDNGNGSDIEPEYNLRREFLDRWQKSGDEKHTNIPAIIPNSSDSYQYYSGHWATTSRKEIQKIANSAWEMYDYSDYRVVSGNYLKCSSLSFTYEFGERILPKLRMSRLALTLSGTNLFTICSSKLKGQTATQSGFATVQLSDRPTYSFSLNVSF